jgi:CheY-like chemotaxis protein
MSKKILLVDSNLAVQKMVEITLAKEGYTVACADNSLSALDMALKSRPDLILADLRLQGMRFEAFCQKLLYKERLNKIPLLLLVPSGEMIEEKRLKSAGVSDIIAKPIDPAELIQKVRRCTEERESLESAPMNAPGLSSLEHTIPPPTEAEREDILKMEEMLGWSQPSIGIEVAALASASEPMQEAEIVENKSIAFESALEQPPDLQGVVNGSAAQNAEPLSSSVEAVEELSQEPENTTACPFQAANEQNPPQESSRPVSSGPEVVSVDALTRDQVERIVRERIEDILWEVVPPLAEAEIRKAIEKLQQEA